jgi:hypothetical protein
MKIKVITFIFTLLITGQVNAESTIIFPANGQSEEQQQQDEGFCFSWAKKETGFDPLASIEEIKDPKKSRGGALRGAAIGTVIGDDQEAAQRGAVVGLARQGRRNKMAQKSVDNKNQQIEAEHQANQQHFNKANAACLEGKGYVVK